MAERVKRRDRAASLLAAVVIGTSFAGGCSAQDPLGGESTTCGQDEGQAILRAGGFDDGGVTVVDGCTHTVTGLRAGSIRTAIARVEPDRISSVLVGADVQVDAASSSRFDAEAPNLGGTYEEAGHPLSFDVETTPDGRPWRTGERLSVRDEVDETGQSVGHDDGIWRRYAAWGLEATGDDYLLMVRLEDGSL
jgi:hypothetical protein